MQILVGVRFLAVMKMRRDGVLEEVHQQVSAQQ